MFGGVYNIDGLMNRNWDDVFVCWGKLLNNFGWRQVGGV